MRVTDAYLGMRPTTKVEFSGTNLTTALSFLEALEEHEDVQRVFTNLDFTKPCRWRRRLKQSLSRYVPQDWVFPIVLVLFVALVMWFGRKLPIS